MGIGEEDSTFREAIHVRSLGSGMGVVTADPVVQIVDCDEQDVRRRLLAKQLGAENQEQKE